MRRLNPRLLFGIGIPVLIVVLLLAAWAVDASRTSGKVPRNVKLAGKDIGGLPEDRLATTVAEIASSYDQLKVEVRVTGLSQRYEIAGSDLGLRLDQQATMREALDTDKGTSVFARPFTWMGSFITPRDTTLQFTVDNAVLKAGLSQLDGNTRSIDPKIVSGADGFTVLGGTPGRQIDSTGVRGQLLDKARTGETPIVVQATFTEQPPAVSDASAQDFANRINAATANGIQVRAGQSAENIDAATVRSWLGAKIEGDKFVLTIKEQDAMDAVKAALPPDSEPKDATFTVVDGAVQMTPGQDGSACCGADAAQRILQAIDANKNQVDLEMTVTKARVSTEDAEKLGIKEPVGSETEWAGKPQIKSFTTYYQPGQSRVINIQKIADDVRGTVIKPGEKFSMNEIVGKRTREKGYVAAGAIANGKHVDEVGGGVSQFATTMFNAAYYAGLKIDTYQAHSEHFSRYPRGREATMGFPNPDLVWTNNSPYGILVWPTYTNTSVTVTLYSTQWATAEQTGTSSSRSGNCTVVTTTRTIHYPDGKTGTDKFQARYRDSGATRC